MRSLSISNLPPLLPLKSHLFTFKPFFYALFNFSAFVTRAIKKFLLIVFFLQQAHVMYCKMMNAKDLTMQAYDAVVTKWADQSCQNVRFRVGWEGEREE